MAVSGTTVGNGTVYVGLVGGLCTAAPVVGTAQISTCVSASSSSGISGTSVSNILPTASIVYIGSSTNGVCTANPVTGAVALATCTQQTSWPLLNGNISSLAVDTSVSASQRLYVGLASPAVSSVCAATLPTVSSSTVNLCTVPLDLLTNGFSTNVLTVDPSGTETTDGLGLAKLYIGSPTIGLLTSF